MAHSLSSIQLDAFGAVARHLHFSEAAKELNITQSALSQRVKNLEDDLGATLFVRDRNNISLSEVGMRLLRYVNAKQSMEGEFLKDLRDPKELAGVIRIAGFSSIARSRVLPAIAPLVRDNPKLQLELLNRELHELDDLLKRARVDFVITDRVLEHSDLKVELLGYEENVLVESNQFKCPDLYLDHDLLDQTTIQYYRLTGKSIKDLRRRYLDEVYALIDGVRFGIGKAVLPRHLIAPYKDLQVVSPKTVLKVPLYLHYVDQAYYTKLHKHVLAALLEYFKNENQDSPR